jgi:uncharacterized protein YprB with RNaseH-like and TPR domain
VTRFEDLDRFYAKPAAAAVSTRSSLRFAELGGHEVITEFGPTLQIDRHYLWQALPAGTSFGRIRSEGWRSALIDPRVPRTLPLDGVVCLDIETTGLSLGAGTVPFLVGIVHAHADGAHLRQYLIRDFSEEPAQLDTLTRALAEFDLLVTYNGASFDVPVLRSRTVINRIDAPWLTHPHLDLLHPIRAVWRQTWPDCRLATAEARLLGVVRAADCEGWEVPLRYRQFLMEQSEVPLYDVLEHNAQDLLSLLCLLATVESLFDPEWSEFGLAQTELFGLARALVGRKRPAQAIEVLEQGRAMGRLAPEYGRAMRLMVRLLKRARQWDRAQSVWRDLFSAADPLERFWAQLEEAKFAEHRARDLTAALTASEAAADALSDLRESPLAERFRAQLSHRQARLKRRLKAG